MPWKIVKGGTDCPFEVVRSDTGARVACHPTEGKAMEHMAALYANVPENERADNSGPPKPYGDVKYADPKNGKYPIDTADHARAALSYFSTPKNQVGYSAEEIAAIMGRIHGACKKFGIEVAEPSTSNRFDEKPRAEIETREADIAEVKMSQRIITVIAAPYEQPAFVSYRGETWQEMFERTAWDGLRNIRPTKIRANRDHNKSRTIGKVVNLWPERSEGLVAEIRCARTPLGDETLALADDDCVSASVGFGVLSDGQVLDRSAKTRRITTAYLDHIALVESPAYEGAAVLGVRAQDQATDTNEQLRLLAGVLALLKDGATPPAERRSTPALDQFTADEMFRWAAERLS